MFYFLEVEVDLEVEGDSEVEVDSVVEADPVVEVDSVVEVLEVDLGPEVPMKMIILPGYCRQFTLSFW